MALVIGARPCSDCGGVIQSQWEPKAQAWVCAGCYNQFAVERGWEKPIPTECGIAYCSEIATYQVEIDGFFKQYMCDRHSEFTYRSTKPEYWFGMERIVS